MLTREQNEFIACTGPGTPMGDLFRHFWLPALLASEVPAPDCPPVRVKLLGEDLVAFRDTQGRVGLLQASCPHRRAELFFGRNEEGGLRCVYHGWKYDAEGYCVDMPNEPAESNFKHKVRTTAYPTQERGGIVWAYMGPREKISEPPDLDFTQVPESHRYIRKYILDCNCLQALEGDIDNSHVSYAHAYLNPQQSIAQGRRVAGRNYYIQDRHPRFTVKDTEYGIMIGASRDTDDDHYYWHITHWLMPSFSIVGGPRPGDSVLCQVRAPIDDEHSLLYRVMWNPQRPLTAAELYEYQQEGLTYEPLIPGTFRPVRNKDNDWLIDRSLQRSWNFTGLKGNIAQDQALTTSMGSIVDRSREHLGTSDTAIIAMRRKLIRAARDLQEGKAPFPAYHGQVYRIRSCGVILEKEVPFDEGSREFVRLGA